jgi:hypothetical protein
MNERHCRASADTDWPHPEQAVTDDVPGTEPLHHRRLDVKQGNGVTLARTGNR